MGNWSVEPVVGAEDAVDGGGGGGGEVTLGDVGGDVVAFLTPAPRVQGHHKTGRGGGGAKNFIHAMLILSIIFYSKGTHKSAIKHPSGPFYYKPIFRADINSLILPIKTGIRINDVHP